MENPFVVITRSKFDVKDYDYIMDLAQRSLPIFEKQKGLLRLAFHVSHDKTETCTYMHWDSKENHDACLTSPDFGPVNDEWHKVMTDGTLQFELQSYELADSWQFAFE